MLPLSCFLLAVSKSNSSSRFPLMTTTRVSSGWVASINIRLAIWQLLQCATGTAPRGGGRRRETVVGDQGWCHVDLSNGAGRTCRDARTGTMRRTGPKARRQIRSAEPVRSRPHRKASPGSAQPSPWALAAGRTSRCTRARQGVGTVGRTKPDTLNIDTAVAADNANVRAKAFSRPGRDADEEGGRESPV